MDVGSIQKVVGANFLKLNSHWTRHGAARHDADLIWFESRDCYAHA